MRFQKKIVLNKDFGGFGLSRAAWDLLLKLGYKPSEAEKELAEYAKNGTLETYGYDIPRDEPLLIEVVERLGDKASCTLSKLKVATITIEININDYDGKESAVVCGGEWWCTP